MKNKLWNTLIGSLFATALSISSANAFLIDTKLGEAQLANSGDATELAWIQSVTGDNSLTLDFKLAKGDNGFNFTPNGPDSWYIDAAPNTPGYFMLKFGTGGTNATADHYLFQNTADLTKLVWSNDQVQFLTGGNCANNPNACNIGRLSHYASSGGGGGTNQIPTPTSLLLLGIGLIGFAYTRRRTS